MLCALKPHGNPLASGRAGLPAAADGLTVRLRETEGRPARAKLRLRGGVAAAHLTDLLEERDLGPLPVQDEEVVVDVPPFGTVTVVLQPVVPPATALDTEPPVPGGSTNLLAETAVPEGTLGGLLEPAQPVYTRYWLHGKGPAPAGNLPVAVHISPHLTGLPLSGPGGGDAQVSGDRTGQGRTGRGRRRGLGGAAGHGGVRSRAGRRHAAAARPAGADRRLQRPGRGHRQRGRL